MLSLLQTDQVVDVAEKIVAIQRDFGDCQNEHMHASTHVEDRGADAILQELEKRLATAQNRQRNFNLQATEIILDGRNVPMASGTLGFYRRWKNRRPGRQDNEDRNAKDCSQWSM